MSGFLSFYCTLDEAMREIRAKDTRDPKYMLGLLPAISQRLMKYARRDFEPVYETRTFVAGRMNVVPSQNALKLNDYLLELEAVSIGGSGLTVGTDVDLYPTNGVKPATKLYLLSTCRSSVTWYGTGCLPGTYSSPLVQIQVAGWWGYKERYAAEGWLTADAIQAAALATNATTFAVAEVEGSDPRGFEPRLSTGQLIRVDDELMRVVETTTSNTLEVLRAQRGTEAAAHAQGAAVKLWNVEEDVRRAAQRWASLQYQRKGVFETARIEEAVITLPADMPVEVEQIMGSYFDDGAGNF
ncbi:MAG: hypothetical protein IPK17_38515 [Chloroflexi bacterium]|uniref:hypothetical protein n=1 Tax=Candidatus Flexifilum breve TaxID=3140694 RepID=UPI0031355EB5|nr:hypothetical protein [Chloroflexota bacterium]